MSDSSQESALNQFISFYNSGLSNHVEQVNQLIPKLLEEIKPDQLIRVSVHLIPQSLLYLLSHCCEIDYESLFQWNASPINCNVLNENKVTPLHEACYWGNEKAVKLLLDHGANVMFARDWISPIVSSYRNGIITDSRLRILRLLIKQSDNVDSESSRKVNNIMRGPVLMACIDDFYGMNIVHTDDEKRQIILFLKELINAGADVNYIDFVGRNALHIACTHSCVDIMKLLVENGCNHKIRNCSGKLPMDYVRVELKDEFAEIIDLVQCR